jgi:hypothetical protein
MIAREDEVRTLWRGDQPGWHHLCSVLDDAKLKSAPIQTMGIGENIVARPGSLTWLKVNQNPPSFSAKPFGSFGIWKASGWLA